jgi:hypothetical protein
MLQAYGRRYYDEIMTLLGVVPSDLLLLLKANDCLRHLDRLLGTPINSTAVVGEVASRIIYEEEVASLYDSRNGQNQGGGWWDKIWSWYGLWTDYWQVKSRVTALSMMGTMISQFQESLNQWNIWRNRVVRFFYLLLGI